jgi:putative transposase
MNTKSRFPFPRRARKIAFDYTSAGYYFVTVVTFERACILSTIENFEVVLTSAGKFVVESIEETMVRYPHVTVDCFTVMPNHLHILFFFDDCADQPVTLSRILNEIKSRTSLKNNRLTGSSGTLWQYSFHDVIIRDDEHLFNEREYIRNNAIKWELDELNPANW